MGGAHACCGDCRRRTVAREEPESVTHIQRQYVRVLVVWVSVLVALYIFQELFS
jgi:hypothetical protein